MILKKYRLGDGSIYWHKLYYDIVPRFMTRYAPPWGSWNYAAYLYRPHKYVQDLLCKIKWFLQRGARGYADCDAWSLDHYLASWMPEALRHLEENKLGHPIGMTKKGWQTRLRIMREGFEAARAILEMPADAKQYRRLERRMHRGLRMLQTHYLSLWD